MRKFLPKTVLVLFLSLFYALLQLPAYAIGLSAFDTEAEIAIDEQMEASTNTTELKALTAEEDKTSYKEMEELPFLDDEEEYNDSDELTPLETDLDDEAYGDEEAGLTNNREAISKTKTAVIGHKRPWRRSATFNATYKRDDTKYIRGKAPKKLVMFYRGKEYPLDRRRVKVLAHNMNKNPFLPFSTLLTVRLQLFRDKTGSYVRPNIIDKVYLNTGKPSWRYTATFPVKKDYYITSSDVNWDAVGRPKKIGTYGVNVTFMDTESGRYLLGDGGLYRYNTENYHDVTHVSLPILDDGDIMGEYVLPNAYERYYLHGKKYGDRQMNECKYMATFDSRHYSNTAQIRAVKARDAVFIGKRFLPLETGLYKLLETTTRVFRGGIPSYHQGKVKLPVYEDKGDPRGEYVIPNMKEKVYLHIAPQQSADWSRTAIFHYLYPSAGAKEALLSVNGKREITFDTKNSLTKFRHIPQYAKGDPLLETGLIAGYIEFPIFNDNDGNGDYVLPNTKERLYLDTINDLSTMTWDNTVNLTATVLLDSELIKKAGTPILLNFGNSKYKLDKGRYKTLLRGDIRYKALEETSTDDSRKSRIKASPFVDGTLDDLVIPDASSIQIEIKMPIYNIGGKELVIPNDRIRVYLAK